MIVYDLICAHQHRFEGWFDSADDYARQRGETMISCPVCDDTAIERRPSANVLVARTGSGEEPKEVALAGGDGDALKLVRRIDAERHGIDFGDSSERRHGGPRIGSWWGFTRIPGRARSHTKTTPTWETYRLVGSLDGHLNIYRHPGLPAEITDAGDAAGQSAWSSILAQPARLPAPTKPAGSWWEHTGALAVVFTGLTAGDLVLPVRLRQGAGRWDHLTHFLADLSIWHKIARGVETATSTSGVGRRPPRPRWVAVLRASARAPRGRARPRCSRRSGPPPRPSIPSP